MDNLVSPIARTMSKLKYEQLPDRRIFLVPCVLHLLLETFSKIAVTGPVCLSELVDYG